MIKFVLKFLKKLTKITSKVANLVCPKGAQCSDSIQNSPEPWGEAPYGVRRVERPRIGDLRGCPPNTTYFPYFDDFFCIRSR